MRVCLGRGQHLFLLDELRLYPFHHLVHHGELTLLLEELGELLLLLRDNLLLALADEDRLLVAAVGSVEVALSLADSLDHRVLFRYDLVDLGTECLDLHRLRLAQGSLCGELGGDLV